MLRFKNMKSNLVKLFFSIFFILTICISVNANEKDIKKLEREIKYYKFTLQDIKIKNNDNISGNLVLNFDDNQSKKGFILEKKNYLGFMSILIDSSSISDFCSFSISRGGKSDFSKNKFIDAKVSAQCQSSNYFKGVVLKAKKWRNFRNRNKWSFQRKN